MVLNRVFLGLLVRRGGPVAAIGGGLLHAAYYLYAPASYLGAVTWHRWTGWMRSPERSTPFTLTAAVLLLAIALIGGSLLMLGFMSTPSLLDWLGSLESDAGDSRYTLDSLGAVQNRLILVGVVLLGVGAWLTHLGPTQLHDESRSVAANLRDLLAIPRTDMLFGAILTLIAAALWGSHLGQQMRLDEASSFAMYATASPLVPLLTYETPNNHILHSILMWASVGVFGPSEWAARLPAFLASLCIPLTMIAAGRKLLSPMIALIGTGLYTGSMIGTDIATNARGYPFVIVAMLVLLGLLPALRERKTGAMPAAAAVGALGLYACPVMAYPLACVLAAWFFAGPAKGTSPLEHITRLARTTIGTGIVAALLYSPAWALRTGSGPLETLGRAARGSPERPGFFRFNELSYNLHAAWAQWTWPAPSLVAIAVFVAALAGMWMWLSRPGWPRAIVIGLVAGVLSVYVATSLAPPPWWILVWFVPVLAVLVATPLAYLAVLISPKPAVSYASGIAAAAVAAAGVLLSSYPADFPYRTGPKDAPAVAEAISRSDLSRAHVVTNVRWYRLLNFELEKRGHGREVAMPNSRLTAPRKESLVHVRSADASDSPELHALPPELVTMLRLERSVEVGESIIDTYRVVTASKP